MIKLLRHPLITGAMLLAGLVLLLKGVYQWMDSRVPMEETQRMEDDLQGKLEDSFQQSDERGEER